MGVSGVAGGNSATDVFLCF